jgi:hypothetical protein
MPTGSVLQNFRDWWEAYNPASQNGRDYTMLFTGKDAGANATYQGHICYQPEFSYTIIVRDYFSLGGNHRYNTIAHEIGHNLDGSHVDSIPGAMTNSPDCYNSILGPPNPNMPGFGGIKICSFTLTEFQRQLSTYPCLGTETR